MKKSKPSLLDKKIHITDLEMILYDLRLLPPAATVADEKNQITIAKTIFLLPEKIQARVLADLTFIAVDGVYGQYEQLYLVNIPKNKLFPVVFLNFAGLDTMPIKKPEVNPWLRSFMIYGTTSIEITTG